MSWTFKTKMLSGYAFNGELPYQSINMEIPTTFKNVVESVRFEYINQFDQKYTGFETIKHKINYYNNKNISIMLIGSLTRGWQDVLIRLATAMNGAGCVLQFSDDWVTGTESVPIVYDCRWVNAGDFVDNNELLCGGSMELVCFNTSPAVVPNEFQKVIDIPVSDLQWQYNITPTGVDHEYYRII